LAKLVKRDFRDIREDVTILSDLGLIELQAGPHVRDAMTLTVPYQYIQFEIAVYGTDMRPEHDFSRNIVTA
jgi:predicted transcriptional regulator